ncbi:hypothetical protein FOQG_19238 [Fusarium oxysporum f. sp. raphani 54005]|uniref:Uncharacterized protein n=1 Tax=Fusarium oxysporum f. sp. raphani 54005 TaxID=1089458 RepID=X0B1K5_FUSOX|nr:hypothetical protein FOQG_19238 [Fusarium oxysporum f. sp. raphani 54005]
MRRNASPSSFTTRAATITAKLRLWRSIMKSPSTTRTMGPCTAAPATELTFGHRCMRRHSPNGSLVAHQSSPTSLRHIAATL